MTPETFKELFFKPKSLFITFSTALFYFSFSVLILNYRLVLITLLNENPINYKFKVFYQLILGSYSAFSLMDFYTLILMSVLVGLNILVTAEIIKRLSNEGGKFSVVFGGSTILGILTVGCSSCGFSILSLLGLTSALSFIPLGHLGLKIGTISLLLFSLFYSIKTYHNKIVCKIQIK